jgi:DNA-directed RNA polymerase specialized sigma24 family protein
LRAHRFRAGPNNSRLRPTALKGEELVQAIAGDAHAFYVLYDRAARLVRAVAADPGLDAAEDVTRDTFLRACWTLNIKRDPARVAPWLVGIA